MSDAPYSDEWRSYVQRRLFDHGTTAEALGKRTGLGRACTNAILGSGPVSIEVAGPIDEELDRLDERRGGRRPARSLAVLRSAPVVAPVAVDSLGALDGDRVQLARLP